MVMLNRRKFFQVSAATFLAENLFAGGEPLPGGAQRFMRDRQPFENNPFQSALEKLQAMVETEITG